jgi:formylglycine-generating enzyme required for sulfatase activity
MKLVLIPPGTFLMGSPGHEATRRPDEALHEVEITKSFYLGMYEVTQRQYKEVMGYNPSYFSRDGSGAAGAMYILAPGGGKDKVAGLNTDDFPVENVSWVEAQDFVKKLSARAEEEKKGLKYRLPTEAEWEHACRGGAREYTTFHYGNSLTSTQANINGIFPYGAKAGVYLARTTRVGSYQHNAFGLYDMHGNVWEWCADWHDRAYYGTSPRRDPPGPVTGTHRVFRGGSCAYGGDGCRSAFRGGHTPGFRDSGLGFRVATVPVAR